MYKHKHILNFLNIWNIVIITLLMSPSTNSNICANPESILIDHSHYNVYFLYTLNVLITLDWVPAVVIITFFGCWIFCFLRATELSSGMKLCYLNSLSSPGPFSDS